MKERNLSNENLLTTFDLQRIVTAFKTITIIPDDPWEQLYNIIESIYNSWDSPSVNMYRDIYGIPWVINLKYYQYCEYCEYYQYL